MNLKVVVILLLVMELRLLMNVFYFVFILIFGKVFVFNLDVKLLVIYDGFVESDFFGYIVVIYFYNG